MSEGRLAQRFRVLRSLEESKLGTLHLAHDEVADSPALVLVLGAKATADAATLDAIVQESAQVASSPDVLLTYACGHTDGSAWLATEAVPGLLLDEVIRRKDKLDGGQIVSVGLSLGRALAALQDSAVQHLDLGPHRVWVEGEGLQHGEGLQTGAARVFGLGWHRLLPPYHAGALADGFYGAAEFLPAELCKSMAATPTADVYSAALTIWALTAGKPPFTSSQPLMTIKRQAVEKPLRLDLVKPALKGVKDIQAWLADALDKDPAKRPQATAWFEAAVELAGRIAPELTERAVEVPAGRDFRLGDGSGTVRMTTPSAADLAAARAESDRRAAEQAAADAERQAKDAERAATESASAEKANADKAAADAAKAAADRAAADKSASTAAPAAKGTLGSEDQTRVHAAMPAEDEDDDDGRDGRGNRRNKKNKKGQLVRTEQPGSATDAGKPALTPDASTKTAPSLPDPKATGAKAVGAPTEGGKPVLPGQPSIIVKNAAGVDARQVKRPMTERTMRVELAESAFFTDKQERVGKELHEQAPPVPTSGGVPKGVIFAVGLFAATMMGVAAYLVSQQAPDKPPTPPDEAAGADDPGTSPSDPVNAPSGPVAAPGQAAAELAPPAPLAPVPAAVDPTAPPATPLDPAAVPVADTGVMPAAVGALGSTEEARKLDMQRLVDEGMALLDKDPKAAIAKAEAALAINPGHAPAERLKKMAQAEQDKLNVAAEAAGAEAKARLDAEAKAAAERATADAKASAEKAAGEAKASAEQAAAEAKGAAAKSSGDYKARQDAEAKAAKEAAGREAAEAKARKAAEAKAAKDTAAATARAHAADEKAARDRAAKEAAKESAAKAAAQNKARKDADAKAAKAAPKPPAAAPKPPAPTPTPPARP
ncbi:MAG: hypothetical protein EXR79_08665, partial [Myxococcales bacterium]|nr:hypothetical protein [Myxococcales bacterium]